LIRKTEVVLTSPKANPHEMLLPLIGLLPVSDKPLKSASSSQNAVSGPRDEVPKGLPEYLPISLTLEETEERFPDYLTAFAHRPSIVAERATSSYSFRFSELRQPI
jgi:hypothetical protein